MLGQSIGGIKFVVFSRQDFSGTENWQMLQNGNFTSEDTRHGPGAWFKWLEVLNVPVKKFSELKAKFVD